MKSSIARFQPIDNDKVCVLVSAIMALIVTIYVFIFTIELFIIPRF